MITCLIHIKIKVKELHKNVIFHNVKTILITRLQWQCSHYTTYYCVYSLTYVNYWNNNLPSSSTKIVNFPKRIILSIRPTLIRISIIINRLLNSLWKLNMQLMLYHLIYYTLWSKIIKFLDEFEFIFNPFISFSLLFSQIFLISKNKNITINSHCLNVESFHFWPIRLSILGNLERRIQRKC